MKILKIAIAMTAVAFMSATSAVIKAESEIKPCGLKDTKRMCNTGSFTVKKDTNRKVKFILIGECFDNTTGRGANGRIAVKRDGNKKILGKVHSFKSMATIEVIKPLTESLSAHGNIVCDGTNSNAQAYFSHVIY
jgi:hypothetical protein